MITYAVLPPFPCLAEISYNQRFSKFRIQAWVFSCRFQPRSSFAHLNSAEELTTYYHLFARMRELPCIILFHGIHPVNTCPLWLIPITHQSGTLASERRRRRVALQIGWLGWRALRRQRRFADRPGGDIMSKQPVIGIILYSAVG